MSIFSKHAEQDKVAEKAILGCLENVTYDNAAAWREIISWIRENLPPHLETFFRYRQEVGNVRYWCGPVAGKYATKGGYVPTRLTMNRMWKAIVNETVRLALKEGLL